MSKQKTLLNFFTKVSKRHLSSDDSSTLIENKSKKIKLDNNLKNDIKEDISNDNNSTIENKNNEISENQKERNYKKEINEIKENDKIQEVTRMKVENNEENEDHLIFDKIRKMAEKYPALQPNIGQTWYKALAGEFLKPYFQQLSNFLQEERKKHTIYPPSHQIWTWTRIFKISEVRVVILGQDPYHNTGQAHGLCFSVPRGIPPPPSLLNMYKELEQDIEGFKRPSHGNLIGWARQGVLLLNACLTVRAHEANSHKDKGWEQLTDAVIQTISNRNSGVVFLLWGAYAQKKAINVDKKKHHLLKAPHPSPLSASRGFFGCKHFSICNQLLEKQGKDPIDWSDLPFE